MKPEINPRTIQTKSDILHLEVACLRGYRCNCASMAEACGRVQCANRCTYMRMAIFVVGGLIGGLIILLYRMARDEAPDGRMQFMMSMLAIMSDAKRTKVTHERGWVGSPHHRHRF